MSGNAIQNDPGYPSLITIVNLWRVLVNDANGEVIQTPLVDQNGNVIVVSVSLTEDPAPGQIVTGETTICAPILMSAVREVCRELRIISSQTIIKDNVCFFDLPTVNSQSYGEATQDPSVQVNLSFVGFNDGVQEWPNFLLPPDCLSITHVWERLAGSQNDFA